MNVSKNSVKKSEINTPIRINPSKFHQLGFGVVSFALFIAVIDSQLFAYAALLIPGLLYCLYHHYLHHFGSKKINELMLQSDGLWQLGTNANYYLLSSSSVRRYWAILYFKSAQASWWEPAKVVAIFPDSLGKEEFRKLRAIARRPHRLPARQPDRC